MENACGSGAKQAFLLLELRDTGWKLTWDSSNSKAGKLSHTKFKFVGEGLDTLEVTGSSWFLDDPKSMTFHESNAGPHRWFVQTWTRHGSAYSLESETLVPSAYNTLVDFVYALRSQDFAAADNLVTNSNLISTARDLGLADPFSADNSKRWSGWCDDRFTYAVPAPLLPPCHVEPAQGTKFLIDMVQVGEGWLITDIHPE
jgi:hypothetical protein